MSTRTAVIYARVSSREQHQEGYSIEAQLKLCRTFAEKNGFEVVREFIEIESAKTAGRKEFGKMLEFFSRTRECRTILVEKTDRLSRNFDDAVSLNQLDVEVHFVKTGTVLSKNAKAQAKFMYGIELVSSKFYSDNLREEVMKGMHEKAEQGVYPGRAPFGYRNNRVTRGIDVHDERASIVRRIFELYAKGEHSLLSLSRALKAETGVRISKGYLHQMLTSLFYLGQFVWRGQTYQGTHVPIISPEMYARVQHVLAGHNKPKYRKHAIAFRGLLTCAHDHCTVTAEHKKGKYVYYRCSGGRGPCTLPRFREQEIAEKLGHVLRDVSIPPDVAQRIARAVEQDHVHVGARVAQERARLTRELATLRVRMDAAYCDKLDGKVSEEFWQRKQADWQAEELRITSQLSGLKENRKDDSPADVRRILELAQTAHSLYLTQKPEEQAKLLKTVLLNCGIDGVSLYPTYRKPFDLIANRVKTEEWSGN